MAGRTLSEIVSGYDPDAPLAEAWTPPASWYTDPRVLELERRTVFSRSWQMVGRAGQVSEPGQFITSEVAGEPIFVVRGTDNVVRSFFNVCRHHAAAVVTEDEGCTERLRCPYHGWTYTLEGKLIGAPDFGEAVNFDNGTSGLISVETGSLEGWLLVKIDKSGPSLTEFLGADLAGRLKALRLGTLRWVEGRRYTLKCNWKVFVDNYLDGGYHVPHLHRGLSSVLDHKTYTVELGDRFCLQSSSMAGVGGEQATQTVRRGKRALFYWIYPNFMINCYQGVMDTNRVLPLGVDRTEVVFDYYFGDTSMRARETQLESIAVSERIQEEDAAICESVQRGLSSRAYRAGRLSPRREAGEHLFHRLLHDDLKAGIQETEE